MRRRGRGPRNGFGGGLFLAVLVLVLAVATGYAGTRYIVYPYLLNGGGSAEKGTADGQNAAPGGTEPGSGSSGSGSSGSGIVAGKQDISDLTPGAVTGGATGAAGEEAAETSLKTVGAGESGQAAGTSASQNASQVSATLYNLQFGSFSTEAAAQEEQNALRIQGIASYVIRKDDAYKVLGMPYLSKDAAKNAAGILKASVSDVFVSTATVSFPDEKQKESLTGLLNSYSAAEQSQDPGKATVLSGMQGPIITMMEGLMK